MDKLLYKTITADTQVSTQECYLVGCQIAHSAVTSMIVYNEADDEKTACRKVATIKCTTYNRQNSMIFPSGGIRCQGIYVDWDAGIGTIWYHY